MWRERLAIIRATQRRLAAQARLHGEAGCKGARWAASSGSRGLATVPARGAGGHGEWGNRRTARPWTPVAAAAVAIVFSASIAQGSLADLKAAPIQLRENAKSGGSSWIETTDSALYNRGKKELLKQYKLGDVLGEGTFAVVRLGVDRKSKERVAVKEISKELSEMDALENEVHIMEKTGKHENIVSLRGVFESSDILYLILDLAEGGELFDRIIERGELTESCASQMFKSAVQGVDHLHKNQIAHLDIKPENLLLTSRNDDAGIKIADFGLAIDLAPYHEKLSNETDDGELETASESADTESSRDVSTQKDQESAKARTRSKGSQGEAANDKKESLKAAKGAKPGSQIEVTASRYPNSAGGNKDSHRVLTECVGTPAYWSPEMVKNEPFDEKVDIWALGCVLYILLVGAHPFDPQGDATEAQILASVAKGKFDTSSPQYNDISAQAKDLLNHMLDPCPDTRYNTDQLMLHPWLAEAGKQSSKPLSKDHLTKLRGFRIIRLLRQGMQHMVGEAASDLFAVFDRDNDGFLCRDELKHALEMIGQRPTKREVDTMIKMLTGSVKGRVSREQFNMVLRAPPNSPYSSLRQRRTSIEDIEFLFRIFDRNKDGYIYKEDFQHVLGLLGVVITESTVTNQIARVDLNRDGRCDFAEFVAYWRMMEDERISGNVSPMHIKHHRTRLAAHVEHEAQEFSEMSA